MTPDNILQQYISKPCVQKLFVQQQRTCSASSSCSEKTTMTTTTLSLLSLLTPQDILACFFGVDYQKNSTEMDHFMKQGHVMDTMKSIWFTSNPQPEYDELCRQSAQHIVEAAATGKLPHNPWYTTVEGRMALLLLCDQFPRNIYRGTEQAFQYDDIALEHARVLVEDYLSLVRQQNHENDDDEYDNHNVNNNNNKRTLQGNDDDDISIYYPPYLAFMAIPFIHSEELSDHEQALLMLDTSRSFIPEHLHGWWDMQRRGSVAHKDVIERFGRFPHRNRSKGRINTPKETEWLEDVDNLPSWAKSQLL